MHINFYKVFTLFKWRLVQLMSCIKQSFSCRLQFVCVAERNLFSKRLNLFGEMRFFSRVVNKGAHCLKWVKFQRYAVFCSLYDVLFDVHNLHRAKLKLFRKVLILNRWMNIPFWMEKFANKFIVSVSIIMYIMYTWRVEWTKANIEHEVKRTAKEKDLKKNAEKVHAFFSKSNILASVCYKMHWQWAL